MKISLSTAILVIFLALLSSAFLLTPFSAHVVRDIAYLYKIDFITALSKENLFGIMFLISFLTMKLKPTKKKEKEDDTHPIVELIADHATVAFSILVMWGLAYFIHKVNF